MYSVLFKLRSCCFYVLITPRCIFCVYVAAVLHRSAERDGDPPGHAAAADTTRVAAVRRRARPLARRRHRLRRRLHHDARDESQLDEAETQKGRERRRRRRQRLHRDQVRFDIVIIFFPSTCSPP